MINTYINDNKVWEVTGSVNSLKEMRKAYVEMGSTASALSAENQALKNAVVKNLDEKTMEKIARDAEVDLQENHYWRNTDEEDRKVLADYGYNKPVALLDDLNEAYNFFDEGFPVFLLNRDNSESPAKNGIEMERHNKDGGLFGTTQFAYEKQEELYFFGDEED